METFLLRKFGIAWTQKMQAQQTIIKESKKLNLNQNLNALAFADQCIATFANLVLQGIAQCDLT